MNLKMTKIYLKLIKNFNFDEFDYTLEEKNADNFITNFSRKISDKQNHFLSITFYNNNQTVFVNVCIT